MERRALRAASQINVVSEGFIPHIRAIAPDVPVSCFTNGIDDLFLFEDFAKSASRSDVPLIVYAGNMGDGQGLHRIVPQVAKALEGRASFRLIGDGSKRRELEDALSAQGLSNVELLPPVSRRQLVGHYREADILFLHLNDLDAFLKVLPSKLFEYGATGRPILAGIAGCAAEFTATELPDAEIFSPCDAKAMIAAFERLVARPARIDRERFRGRHARRKIMAAMAENLLGFS